MGLYDRDYTRESFGFGSQYAPQMRMAFPRMTPMVKRLLIINVAVFLLSFLIPRLEPLIFDWLSVYPATWWMCLQLWRPITYQFLHGGIGHIFVNMLVLYFFGPVLERLWGSKKFLIFYLVCGAMGGLFFPLLVHVGWLRMGQLVGASGSILGMLAAAAILFPNMRVFVWGIFPVKITILALIFAGISIVAVLRPDLYENAGGQAAHLAGMAAGAVYVLSESRLAKLKLRIHSGRWEKKMAAQQNFQIQVDRILQKVHQSGIHSLTSKEKKILKKATEAEQMRNRL
jgi:membrane associated rhomboid family serine protease